MAEEYDSELLVDCRCLLGESPFWDLAGDAIAWVDVDRGHLHRLSPSTGDVARSDLPPETSFAAAAVGGAIVSASPAGVMLHAGEGTDPQPVAPPWFDPTLARPNDGAVDVSGRVWVGSTRRDREPGSGSMGVVIDGEWNQRIGDLTLPNGIAWSLDGRQMFYVDTFGGTLWTAAYDPDTAHLTGQRPLFELERERGLIDGICADVDGFLWAAVWGGHEVLRIDPTGLEVGRVRVGTEKVTSCAFGPAGSTVLYITSADPQGSGGTGDGGLFAADVGVSGVPVAPAMVRPTT